ncbi:putative acyl-[acyl-carrier-protein] desaturase desA1 [Mycobacterium xenopi 3993]|nr:putative acyl-[acyl-carrier-protein] desaturase desA1 [Mycobacterium xenopi 3993]
MVGRQELLRARRPRLVPEQSKLSDVAQVAMVQNLVTEDNLPSYHREIAMNFGMDGPWGQWVNRWTAEENRHGISLRDYLVVTRAVDPVELEKLRIEVVNRASARARTIRASISPSVSPTRSSMSRSRSWPPGFRTATPARRATRPSPIS